MDEEMILSISRIAQMSKEDVIEKVKEYRISPRSIYDFYLAFGKFPTPDEANAIAAYGVDNLVKVAGRHPLKVIHVELKKPYLGNTHYYFGSQTAIYGELPEEIVGIKKESLWNVDLEAGEYSNRLCTIRMGTLRRKQTARGGNKQKGGL